MFLITDQKSYEPHALFRHNLILLGDIFTFLKLSLGILIHVNSFKNICTCRCTAYPSPFPDHRLFYHPRADMIQIYKIMHGLDELDLAHFFDHPTDNRTRGHRYKIVKKNVYSKLRHGSFSQRCINEWNNLSSVVVESMSLNSFKSNLLKFWSSRKDQYDPEESFACPCSSIAV